jgi:uncharacterized protein YqgV (UPF0045/DUF77 family)
MPPAPSARAGPPPCTRPWPSRGPSRAAPADVAPYDPGVQELEFTVEPFVEGRPGAHVAAAIRAATDAGTEVEVGPFGSSCRTDDERMPDLVAAITRAAFENGATHLSLHVARVDGAGA